MKISKELDVSISALIFLKISVEPITSIALAKEVKTTKAYIGQILKKLRKSNLVCAKKGPNGGYVFNWDRKEISTLEVAIALGHEFSSIANFEISQPQHRLDNEIIKAFARTKI